MEPLKQQLDVAAVVAGQVNTEDLKACEGATEKLILVCVNLEA
jgi:hypothetical protein